nr:putative ribonuclease H-like domain-containing protein [Tanacetum cinerariifolium]
MVDFLEVKNASTPIETQKPLIKEEYGEEVNVHMYRSMIGSLMYLISSRPDIMFAVYVCVRYQVNPKVSHLHVVKGIFSWKLMQLGINLLLLVEPRRKVTRVPQPSDPIEHVVDEAVNKEIDDSLERAATTATSLDTEQDIGVTTPQSGKDSLKLTELMELCTKLQQRTTQALEIDSLKRRVKKLERKKRSRTHRLKRLYKIILSVRVKSSKNEGFGEEDASKQGRIADIDANEDIYLVNVHNDEDLFGVNDLDGDEAIVEGVDVEEQAKEGTPNEPVPKELVPVVVLGTKKPWGILLLRLDGDEAIVEGVDVEEQAKEVVDDITLAKSLMEIKSAKPKAIKVVIQEQEQELFDKATKKVNTYVDFRTELVEESLEKVEAKIIQEGSLKRAGDELEQERSKK